MAKHSVDVLIKARDEARRKFGHIGRSAAAGIAKEVQMSSTEKLERNIDSQIEYVLNKRQTG